MYDQGELHHKFKERTDLLQYIKTINKNKWIVHLEAPMDEPIQVVRYIGRYSKRACLSEYKITKMEGEYIAFRHKDYKAKDNNNQPIERELELHFRDFFPRLLQHVPMRYFRIVRYYGLYSNKSEIPEEYLSKERMKEKTIEEDLTEGIQENQKICIHCKKRKMYQYSMIINRISGYMNIYKRLLLENKNELKKNAA
jgi:hypothetical protein